MRAVNPYQVLPWYNLVIAALIQDILFVVNIQPIRANGLFTDP